MSKLYYSEQGNVIPSLCEELTDYRRARKVLELPGTREPARLYVLARSYPENKLPLRISVNGTELPSLAPIQPDIYFWYEVHIHPTLLKAGANTFEFWTDSPAMNGWSLAMENGHKDPRSFVSVDAGRTWRNEKLGYHNISFGEYVVRVRLAEEQDPPPPTMVWEHRDHPRLRRLGELLPDSAWKGETTLARVQSLLTWASTSWFYRNTGTATQYAPWDPETILAWGKSAHGHNGREPVVMCVQYAVTLVMSCLAVGIPARPAVFTGDLNGFNGHFTGEVWLKEHNKWAMVDPTIDVILSRDNVPLSVSEIQQAGDDLTDLIRFGPGYEYQRQNPVITSWIPENLAKGVCFRHRSLWPRTDFLSHLELTPPGHGESAYSETNLVWETKDLADGFGMFPYFGDKDYFDAPPRGFQA